MIALTFSGDILLDGLIQGLVYALVAFGLLLIIALSISLVSGKLIILSPIFYIYLLTG